jgi:hypothetical protein
MIGANTKRLVLLCPRPSRPVSPTHSTQTRPTPTAIHWRVDSYRVDADFGQLPAVVLTVKNTALSQCTWTQGISGSLRSLNAADTAAYEAMLDFFRQRLGTVGDPPAGSQCPSSCRPLAAGLHHLQRHLWPTIAPWRLRSVHVEKPLYCVVGHCGCGLPSASVGHHCRALRAYAEPLPPLISSVYLSMARAPQATIPIPLPTPGPRGMWVQVFLPAAGRPSWSAHSEEGFYVGSAPNCTSSTVSGSHPRGLSVQCRHWIGSPRRT